MVGWIYLLSVLSNCVRISSADNGYYTAGVVEFRPAVTGGNSSQLLEENLLAYLALIKEANGTTDIIVFPEATLNTQLQLTAVPEANPNRSICDDDGVEDDKVAPFLRELACAAQEAHTYLVVNVKEREYCHNESLSCPSRGYNIYNSNVVFDRRGAIVSRYRKWNLYLEPYTNRTSEPEYATFETDFNVTFGHFICFDMLFYEPAQSLVERLGIHDIIVTKMFNSELPFLTATQFQQAWAWGNNVNLLASGASLPTSGITGSGIYAGRHGALARLMVANQTEGERKLLLARVPIWSAEADPVVDLDSVEHLLQNDLPLLQQQSILDFSSDLLPLFPGLVEWYSQKYYADLFCEFNISMFVNGNRPPKYYYRVVALMDRRRYEEEQYSLIRVCALYACRNSSVESCGMLNEETDREMVEFQAVRIRGNFVQRNRRLLMPNSLTESLYALQPTDMTWLQEDRSNGTTWAEVELTKPQELLAFGIYGNYFDEDNQEDNDKGTGTTKHSSKSLVLILLLSISIFIN
ncbi:vanin-like protein 3 [Drosophila willistoni]|uniref:vanin-like protein 3 n=1 Tax=Drosophila willistoni TaxID=7260 RepID=UPI000C26D358|nr:vanin-like protein 3 [Drosophila willistoni]